MKRYLFVLLVVIILGLVCAGAVFAQTQSEWTTVDQVHSYDNGHVNFVTSANITTSCSNQNGFRINHANAEGSHMYHMLMAAFLSGKEVRVSTTGSCTGGGWNIVSQIDVR